MRLTALERTKDLPSPKLVELLSKGWLGAVLILPARLYFGVEWVKAGWEKVTDRPGCPPARRSAALPPAR